jgi:oxygen-independent coproporphyrinogen III oxidase
MSPATDPRWEYPDLRHPGVGLYLHVPFCRRKCPYCDFFSLPATPELLHEYPALVVRQLELAQTSGDWPGPLASVFFGGGTPSLLSPAAIGCLLDAAEQRFGFCDGAEISLEANPGTVTEASLAGYRAAGVNRLSLGVQSLSPTNLALLGRIHSAGEAVQALRWARRAGFASVSGDLIFALPGQNAAAALADVDQLLQLGPEHLSCYGLALEPGTALQHAVASGQLTLPDENGYADIYLALHERLAAAGFEHYEISNYARPGHACRHNLNTWQRGSYLGLGPGAHSFLARDWGIRLAVPGDWPRYRRRLTAGKNPAEILEVLDRSGAMTETLYLGLRCAAGVDENQFRRRFGLGLAEAFPTAWQKTAPRLHCRRGHWSLEASDWLIFDTLISAFL